MTTVPGLWLKHRPFARHICRDYFIPGAEDQDVEQEALIALWEAAVGYRPDQGAAFKTFAEVVIRRHLMDCVTTANRGKQTPLNDSVRTLWDENGEDRPAVDSLPHLHQVTDLVEDREQLRAVLRTIDQDLSDLERRCIVGIARGLSYLELGSPGEVNNALCRARQKLRAAA